MQIVLSSGARRLQRQVTSKYGNTADTNPFIDPYPVTGTQIRYKAEFHNPDTSSAEKPTKNPPKSVKNCPKNGQNKGSILRRKNSGKTLSKRTGMGEHLFCGSVYSLFIAEYFTTIQGVRFGLPFDIMELLLADRRGHPR